MLGALPQPEGSPQGGSRIEGMIVDCRDTLRVDDHPALHQPGAIPVWVMTPEHEALHPQRLKFLLEGVHSLRQQCRRLGGDLVVRHGNRATILNALAQEWGCAVAISSPSGWDERQEDARIQHCRVSDNRTLFRATQMDASVPLSSFSRFRKAVEKQHLVDSPVPAPTELSPLPKGLAPGPLPEPPAIADDARSYGRFSGGESAAQQHLARYFADPARPLSYKETRNRMHGFDGSTKFSPWLAQGSLSPRRAWHRVLQFEGDVQANASTYWIRFELLWREYFHWWARSRGPALYGRRTLPAPPPVFDRWAQGQTGVPIIDANMRELQATGYMSNRGRQNVASFLIKDLGVDWRLGADYFEQHLLDYDPASNWGNWAYLAGTGADPREDRWFNVLSQGQRYDPDGSYVRHWLPHLRNIPDSCVHWPWLHGGNPPLVCPDRWHDILSTHADGSTHRD